MDAFLVIIIIPLPPSGRGSHVKSDYERTIIYYPLGPYTRHLRLDISICALFTVYPNHANHVTASRPSPGGSPPEREKLVRKNAAPNQKLRLETQSSTYTSGLTTPSYLWHISTVIPLLPKATFSLSIPLPSVYFVTAINALLAIRYLSILFICPNHLNAL